MSRLISKSPIFPLGSEPETGVSGLTTGRGSADAWREAVAVAIPAEAARERVRKVRRLSVLCGSGFCMGGVLSSAICHFL
jgi:hypothetical protein